ncbi:type II secretion system F family protein [Streptomyces sp. NPDC001663]|uniref:type II secretion system F family protein n=1 Tax=Streptomyces sp. NPDC001663 TaxID=3364597 RepID=UPI0036B9C4F8
MMLTMLLGAGVGLGLWALIVWLVPPKPRLADLLTRLRRDTKPATPSPAELEGWAARLGAPFVGLMRFLGLPRRGIAADLVIAERSVDSHLAEKASLGLIGLLLPTTVQILVVVGGHSQQWAVPAGASLAFAGTGFLLPDLTVRAEARRRRAAFRHALGSYLNLIHILLAGGAGLESALHDAVDIGQGRAFEHLRRTLNTARFTRSSPWTALGRLGSELQIDELTELAASLSLAGSEGAKIRASLSAKAAAMRHRDGAEAEGRASAATERMALPCMLMAFGFVLFVFYPAFAQITASL